MSCAVTHRARAFRISELQEHPSNPEAEKIMGLYLKKVLDNKAEIAVWQITETEEELKEDMSILSTEEENLEMARRNSAMNKLSDDDYKTTQDDMMFLNDIVALNNQVHVEQSDRLINTQNVLSALMKQTQSIDNYNRIDMSELKSEDVDFIIGLLRMGTADSSNYTDENNDELNILSEKFLALLRDSIINHKVFRIDFDNKISVIIKIDVEYH